MHITCLCIVNWSRQEAEGGAVEVGGWGESKQYLNGCISLLLGVECCHGFGTRPTDEYAEQLQRCPSTRGRADDRIKWRE